MAAIAEKEKEASQIVVADAPYSKRADTPAPAGQPANLMQALAAAAANPAMDVAKVERLYAMHKEMMDRAAEQAFNDAMARTQAEIAPIVATAWNDQTKSKYAKLEAIDRVITPIHTKHGLSVSYDTETKNEADPVPPNMLRILMWIRHSGGHKQRHHIDLPPDGAGIRGTANKTEVHAIGSTNAYGRRYLKLMGFNVSTFDDKDGNSAGGNGSAGRMDEKKLADHLAAMEGCADEAGILKAFAKGYNEAEDLKDKDSQRVLMAKRDDCRKKLRQPRRS